MVILFVFGRKTECLIILIVVTLEHVKKIKVWKEIDLDDNTTFCLL